MSDPKRSFKNLFGDPAFQIKVFKKVLNVLFAQKVFKKVVGSGISPRPHKIYSGPQDLQRFYNFSPGSTFGRRFQCRHAPPPSLPYDY